MNKSYPLSCVFFNTIQQQERQKYEQICEDSFLKAKKATAVKNTEWLDSPWPNFFVARDPMKLPDTSVAEERLQLIGQSVSTPPSDDFTVHNGKWLSAIICQPMSG